MRAFSKAILATGEGMTQKRGTHLWQVWKNNNALVFAGYFSCPIRSRISICFLVNNFWVDWSTPAFLCCPNSRMVDRRKANVICQVDSSAREARAVCHGCRGLSVCIALLGTGHRSSSRIKTDCRVWRLAKGLKFKLWVALVHSPGPFPNTISQLQLVFHEWNAK